LSSSIQAARRQRTFGVVVEYEEGSRLKSSKEKQPKESKKKTSEKPARKTVKAKAAETIAAANGIERAAPAELPAEKSLNGAAAPEPVVIIESVVVEYDPPRELIEARAYELFVQRGYVDGYHMEDWLTAEYELKSKHRSA
jgi:hypothetical protein